MLDGWIGLAVAVVFAVSTLLCATSLAVHGTRRRRTLAAAEVNHVVMGIAMVLMATAATAALVPPVLGTVVFALAAVAWFGVVVVAPIRGSGLGPVVGRDRCTGHPVHLLLLDVAMIAMYQAMTPSSGGGHDMAGMGPTAPDAPADDVFTVPSTLSVVALLVALYLVGHAVASVAAVVRRGHREVPEGVEVGPATGAILMAAPVEQAPARSGVAAVLASVPVQVAGEVGMSLAMAVLLVVGLRPM